MNPCVGIQGSGGFLGPMPYVFLKFFCVSVFTFLFLRTLQLLMRLEKASNCSAMTRRSYRESGFKTFPG